MLDDIVYYVAVMRRRPETGIRLYFDIREAVNKFFQMGMHGHAHPALPDGRRYLKFKRWLIAYEGIDAGILIHRVVDVNRDLDKVFNRGT